MTVQEKNNNLLYEILGLERSASNEEIRKAYKIRALKLHPDKNPDDADASKNFQKLQQAYNILKDENSRKIYDATGNLPGDGFGDAADYFAAKFGRISEEDIISFEKSYRCSDAEVADVREHYIRYLNSRISIFCSYSRFDGRIDKLLVKLYN